MAPSKFRAPSTHCQREAGKPSVGFIIWAAWRALKDQEVESDTQAAAYSHDCNPKTPSFPRSLEKTEMLGLHSLGSAGILLSFLTSAAAFGTAGPTATLPLREEG